MTHHTIKHINLKTPDLSTIQQHLDFDEAFHTECDLNLAYRDLYLRLWEPSDMAVVLGRSNRLASEVNLPSLTQHAIPCFFRSSGGGAVILGPGCFMYSLFIPTSYDSCRTISLTNTTVMTLNQTALSRLIPDVSIQGVTDLCIGTKKFSGNAQRRKKRYLLFHGTFLYDFDLPFISEILAHPSKEPPYRLKRSHRDFLISIPVSSDALSQVLIDQWQCSMTHVHHGLSPLINIL